MRMSSSPPEHPGARNLRIALELYQAGEDMMWQSLRRRYPHADEAELKRRLNAWRIARPGAELGDAEGRPRGDAEGRPLISRNRDEPPR